MSKAVVFILGLFVGVVLTAVAVNVFGPQRGNDEASPEQPAVPPVSTALLHTNMPQDSVILILGDPVHTSTEILGGTKVDSWQYSADKNTTATLLFSDGRLNSIAYSKK